MKRTSTTYIIVLIFLFSCTPSKKTQLYNNLKKEIAKDVFQEFERYLPMSYENCKMATLRNAPNYNAFGLSGIDVMYDLDTVTFHKNVGKLDVANVVPPEIFSDSAAFNYSNSEYYSIIFNDAKIAIPRVELDFCHDDDTCYTWTDLKTVILEFGTKEVFSKTVDSDFKPDNPNCNYSIGAFYSQQKKDIIYWLFIYD